MERSLSDAIALAAAAHAGQMDKSGRAYILHPIRVMQRCESYGPAVQMAAVLHDTVEDTWVTLDILRAAGYAPEIVDAVDALSRRKGEETYFEYIHRCGANPIARLVKLADLDDNSDPARRFGDRFDTLLERYDKARAILSAALS
jgi:GTP diphosphokinase / guanosine-3',5'-bis(diphosphate) 3'-diphosphatase